MQTLSFLIAGAQKAGTTALDAYLRPHPALEMARDKEAHFFDRESGVDWRDPDYGRLHALYDGPPDRLRGEATPVTLYWTPAHYRILRYNPDMKFIILLRDPVARAFSHWRMNMALGLDSVDFSTAIRSGRTRVLDDPAQNGLARHSSYIERGYYGRQIALLGTLFPISNMLFLRQDDLLGFPDAVLETVAAFLGVAPFAPVATHRLNVADADDGLDMAAEDRAYLAGLFAADLQRLKSLTGIDLTKERATP